MSERPSDEATNDAAVASEDAGERAYHVKLPMFEGPLDLLLHLIQKHELNILDIPIGFVAQKYVEYIRLMEEMSIDIASEYLVMAATLAHLKSRSLLPPDPTQEAEEATEEEEEDPRAELIRKLLEYQKYKHAADNLGQREVLGRDVFQRGLAPEQSDEEAPLAPMSLFKLVDAFENVLKRARQVQEHHIDFEKVSITDRIGQIVERLRAVGTLQFEQLFDGDVTRAEMIVTFLALLEMTKLRMTRLAQEGPLAPIVIELVLTADQARNFQAERAFEQVMEAVEHDFAAEKPRLGDGPSTDPPLSPWEAEALDLDQLSDEELAEELREAAQAFALGEEELHERVRQTRDVSSAVSTDLDPDEPWFTFGPPVEDDFSDDDDVTAADAEAALPEAALPEAALPQAELPQAELPQAELPNLDGAPEEGGSLRAEPEETLDANAASVIRAVESEASEAAKRGDAVEFETPEFALLVSPPRASVTAAPDVVEHATEEHATEELATEEHATEEHATEELATEEHATEELATEELATEELATEELATVEFKTDVVAPADSDAPTLGQTEERLPAAGVAPHEPEEHQGSTPAAPKDGEEIAPQIHQPGDVPLTEPEPDESPEPQTKEENEAVSEGSQDPHGSDVESR